MSDQNGFDFNVSAPIGILIRELPDFIVKYWESIPSASNLDPRFITHVSTILKTIRQLRGPKGLARLEKAIKTGDEHALAACRRERIKMRT